MLLRACGVVRTFAPGIFDADLAAVDGERVLDLAVLAAVPPREAPAVAGREDAREDAAAPRRELRRP